MADTDAQAMTDHDIATPPATTDFEPATPLKNAGVDFEATDGKSDSASTATGSTDAIKDGARRLQGQATDRLRAYAQDGQARAVGALDQLIQTIHDAADQIDDKLGAQYGDYARQAAGTVSGFADTVKNKDIDELFDDARAFIRKSPSVAIGGAAAIGFVLARLVQSGVEANRDAPADRV